MKITTRWLYIEAGIASVVVLVVRGGKMLGDQHFFLQNIEGRGEPEVLSAFVRQHYEGPTRCRTRFSRRTNLKMSKRPKNGFSDKAKRRVSGAAPAARRQSASTRNGGTERRAFAARAPQLQRDRQACTMRCLKI
jgi:excinuclease UvrABC nuclease subunit